VFALTEFEIKEKTVDKKEDPGEGVFFVRAPRFCNFKSRVTNSITKSDQIKADNSVTQSGSAFTMTP